MLAAFNHCLTWIYSCASSCHAPSPSLSSMGHVCRAYLHKKIRSEVTRGDVRCSSVWRWQVSTQRGDGRYSPSPTLAPTCPTPLLWLQGGHKRLPRSMNTHNTQRWVRWVNWWRQGEPHAWHRMRTQHTLTFCSPQAEHALTSLQQGDWPTVRWFGQSCL